MTLNQFAADRRRAIFDALAKNEEPPVGVYDTALLLEARTRGLPQMGSTHYEPSAAVFEFIYPDRGQTAVILTVRVEAPEPIVFMPVPSWVVENIWQGDISGTYHFESDAQRLLTDFAEELAPRANQKWFAPQPAKRRE